MEIEIVDNEILGTEDFKATASPTTWVKENGDTAIMTDGNLLFLIKSKTRP